MIVKGTKIIKETSFVTNIEEKNTLKTKKKVISKDEGEYVDYEEIK